MLAVRLPVDIEHRPSKLAKKTGRSRSFHVRQALSACLADLEDFYLAEKRVKSYAAATAIGLSDLLHEHGIGR